MKDEVRLYLPISLENRRIEFENYLVKAQKIIKGFAAEHGWEKYIHEPFMKKAMIFDDKKKFDSQLASLAEIEPETELPDTYCAALEKEVLIAVSPEYYAKVYPDGVEEDSYEKLLAHEIAHRLHIRILDGDEDAMGPVWFFEGFAVFAAYQFRINDLNLSEKEIIDIIDSPERGSYKKYAYVFRHILNRASLNELLYKAGKADFTDWIKAKLVIGA